jgi:heme exporter protein A
VASKSENKGGRSGIDPAAPAIQLEKVSKVFGNRRAVDNLSLELPRGAFLSIFGPNGAGKTTLLRMLSTLSRPTAGSAHLLGIDLKDDPDSAREHIGLISHNSMLYADLTAEENLLIAAHLYGIQEPEARVAAMLEAVELSHRRLDIVRTFSRGMTQRLSIARALIHDPDVVFLDEPYSGLDPHAVEIFDNLIDAVREDRTFVMVSHDLRKGFESCTHALVMARGKKVAFAPKDEIDYDAFEALYRETVGMGVA